jgi:hypothetical protein
VAQSVGLNPVFIVGGWVVLTGIQALKELGDAKGCDLINEYLIRLDIAEKNLKPYGELEPIINPDKDIKPRFSRALFWAFAVRCFDYVHPDFILHQATNTQKKPNDSTTIPRIKDKTRIVDRRLNYILDLIKGKGWNPLCIPERGKAEIKKICLAENTDLRFTDSTFESAWKRGNTTNKTRVEGYEKYINPKQEL